ncbi:MAG: AmmeMemoRadiSam system protein B [Patescibacteria group bacterium]|nr:AmmeMemoRadiSam system protein B [Patescibacteria group bacterium]
MPIVFAAITPHPPIIIDGIGKNKKELVNKTITAFEKLEQNLYTSKPDVIVIISPHGDIFENTFAVNLSENFVSHYEKFGDFATQESWTGEIMLGHIIKEKSYEKNLPVQLITEAKLDHGSSIPLSKLTKHFQNIKILPIGNTQLDPKTQLEFGQLLYEIFSESEKRIAIIASADLSHALNSDSPAGFHKDGEEFDKKIIELLESHNTAGIVNLDPELVKNASQCGYNSIITILGCLRNINYSFKNICYETSVGIGYLTGEFVF